MPDHTSERRFLPIAVEAGEAGLAGEELLQGGLFEVALLGDEPVQRAQQRIHIAQRRRDGALFVGRREQDPNRANECAVEVLLIPSVAEPPDALVLAREEVEDELGQDAAFK